MEQLKHNLVFSCLFRVICRTSKRATEEGRAHNVVGVKLKRYRKKGLVKFNLTAFEIRILPTVPLQ